MGTPWLTYHFHCTITPRTKGGVGFSTAITLAEELSRGYQGAPGEVVSPPEHGQHKPIWSGLMPPRVGPRN